jgi:hypothetical protein
MGNVAIKRADDLPSAARRAVERVLGRALEDEEEVSIMALPPHEAPTGEARRALARQLEDRIKKTAERVPDVSTEVQESAIDEAVNHVRSQHK